MALRAFWTCLLRCPKAGNHDLRVSEAGKGLYQTRPVLCSGLVLGTAAAFETWTDAMLTLIFLSRFESMVLMKSRAFMSIFKLGLPGAHLHCSPPLRCSLC